MGSWTASDREDKGDGASSRKGCWGASASSLAGSGATLLCIDADRR